MTSPANLGGSIPPTPRTANAYRTPRHNVRPWAKWEPPDDRAPTAHRVAPAGLSSTAIAAQRTGRGQMGIPQMTERPLRPGTGQTTLPTAPAEQQGALWKAGEKMGPGAATRNTVPSCHEPKWPHDHCWSPTGHCAQQQDAHNVHVRAAVRGATDTCTPVHVRRNTCTSVHVRPAVRDRHNLGHMRPEARETDLAHSLRRPCPAFLRPLATQPRGGAASLGGAASSSAPAAPGSRCIDPGPDRCTTLEEDELVLGEADEAEERPSCRKRQQSRQRSP